MKYSVSIALLLTSLGVTLAGATIAHAQCYGDTAQAFGCGVEASTSGDLERFGAPTGNEVIPDYGAGNGLSPDNLFSDQERRKMYRDIVVKPSSSKGAETALTRSMNSSARPIRAQKSVSSRLSRRYRVNGRAF